MLLRRALVREMLCEHLNLGVYLKYYVSTRYQTSHDNKINAFLPVNHWTRLFIIAIVLIVDFYLYYFERSESTSYSAHLGGFVVGLLVGIVFLDNIEVSDFEKYFLMPGTHLAVFLCSIGGIYAYLYIFPPIDAILGSKFPPCCWQLLSCSTIEPDEYAFLDCYEPYDLKGGVQFRDTCNELTDWVEQCRDYMAALAQGGDHDDRYEKCLREVRE